MNEHCSQSALHFTPYFNHYSNPLKTNIFKLQRPNCNTKINNLKSTKHKKSLRRVSRRRKKNESTTWFELSRLYWSGVSNRKDTHKRDEPEHRNKSLWPKLMSYVMTCVALNDINLNEIPSRWAAYDFIIIFIMVAFLSRSPHFLALHQFFRLFRFDWAHNDGAHIVRY